MALISHIQASELAFENGNHKFLISEIIDISDKKNVKKGLIFDGVFSQEDGIFEILSINNTPHDFLTVHKTFLAQLEPILEGGGTESSLKLGPQE